MKDNSQKNNTQNEFDFFYSIFKNWKLILLLSFVFAVLGIAYVFIVPKTYVASTGFSISLDKSIETPYGEYQIKTRNPAHYLSVFELPNFKNKVSSRFGDANLGDYSFKIIKERIDLPPNRDELIFSNKYELLVRGANKEALVKISDTAISQFLQSADENLQEDMYSFFTNSLDKELADLKLKIQIKKDLMENLSFDDGNIEAKTGFLNLKDSLKFDLLEKFKSENTLLISSILLNKEEGTKNYMDAVLTVEKVELKKLESELKSKTLLLERIENNDKSLKAVFGQPFSNSFLTLYPSSLQADDWMMKSIKQIIIFFFAGFFIATVVVAFKTHYDIVDKRQK